MRYLFAGILYLFYSPMVSADFLNDLDCLSRNIYFEASGESYEGKMAVASVTMNRVENSQFPDTVCEVVTQAVMHENGIPVRHKCQFSWYCDGRPDEIVLTDREGRMLGTKIRAWADSVKIAVHYLTHGYTDITNGALFYYAPKKTTPYWAKYFRKTASIGNHIMGVVERADK